MCMLQTEIANIFDKLEAVANRRISEGETPAIYMYKMADVTIRLAVDNILESDFVIEEGRKRIERISRR